jgi:hypothetical protein
MSDADRIKGKDNQTVQHQTQIGVAVDADDNIIPQGKDRSLEGSRARQLNEP